MVETASNGTLAAVKARLGPLRFLRLPGLDLTTAHASLGEEVGSQVKKILEEKLNRLSSEDTLAEQLRQVRRCRRTIQHKLSSNQIQPKVRAALKEYLDCLKAWGHGTGLEQLRRQLLPRFFLDGEDLDVLDLALYLQDDNTGCQTGLYRTSDGSVVLWHTEEEVEEEVGNRFDQLRVAIFNLVKNGKTLEISAFIYPDLLPGPAFCWRSDGFTQAVDTLFIAPRPDNGAMLANVACWITLRLGQELPVSEIIRETGPFLDGYALITAKIDTGKVSAEKTEYAASLISTVELPTEPESYLFQVNTSSDSDGPIARLEDFDAFLWQKYFQRHARTEQALAAKAIRDGLKPPSTTDVSLDPARFCLGLIASTAGGNFAYANKDVKAFLVNRISPQGMEIWLGPGPALPDERPQTIQIPFPH